MPGIVFPLCPCPAKILHAARAYFGEFLTVKNFKTLRFEKLLQKARIHAMPQAGRLLQEWLATNVQQEALATEDGGLVPRAELADAAASINALLALKEVGNTCVSSALCFHQGCPCCHMLSLVLDVYATVHCLQLGFYG